MVAEHSRGGADGAHTPDDHAWLRAFFLTGLDELSEVNWCCAAVRRGVTAAASQRAMRGLLDEAEKKERVIVADSCDGDGHVSTTGTFNATGSMHMKIVCYGIRFHMRSGKRLSKRHHSYRETYHGGMKWALLAATVVAGNVVSGIRPEARGGCPRRVPEGPGVCVADFG